MRILIDADGCPVVDITVFLAKKYTITWFGVALVYPPILLHSTLTKSKLEPWKSVVPFKTDRQIEGKR